MNREQLAWAAGIIDGEGCCLATKRTGKVRNGERIYYNPRLIIGQTNAKEIPQMLTRFKELFSVGNIYGPKPRPKKHWTPIYEFQVDGFEKVQAIYAMIWPWLGNIKRQQYIKAMTIYLENRPPFEWYEGPKPGSRKDWARDKKGRFVKHA